MYRVLSDSAIERIHEASLDILETVGMQIDNAEAREVFRSHGAAVEGTRARLPRGLIERSLATVPAEFTLHGRLPENDAHYADGSFRTSTGGSAIYVLDLDSGARRPATCGDLHDIMALVDTLPDIDVISLPVYLNGLSKPDVDVNRFFSGLKLSTKHVIGAVYTREGLGRVERMAEIVSGTSQWHAKPVVSVVLCPIISPLRLDEDATGLLVDAASRGIITHNFSMAQAGCTAPVTLAGVLTMMNAEALAVTALVQCISPGLPCMYCTVPGLTDMATAMFVTGGIESALLNVGATQMARRYRMPNWATAARTDSKLPDAQAGYEHALTVPYVSLAGASHVTCGAGFLDFVLSVSFEQYVINNEIIGMVRRMLRGIEVTDETVACGLIKDIGPGGTFLAEAHTVRHMRKEFYRPLLSDRREYGIWLKSGGKDARERARDIARERIRNHERRGITPAQEKEMTARVEGIIANPARPALG